jgi:hypothetical protein
VLTLFVRAEFASEPTQCVRCNRILDHRPEDVLAFRAFKGAQIAMARAGLDPGQHHAALAHWANWPFNRKQRWFGMIVGVRHVMHPCFDQAGARHSQSPIKAEDDAVMAAA